MGPSLFHKRNCLESTMMSSLIPEQVQESSGSTPPEARQAVEVAQQVHNARPPVSMTPGAQLGMPPWEPSTGNLNVNPVDLPPLGFTAGEPRGPLPTLPSGSPIRQTHLTDQPQYTAALHPSQYPYRQHLYRTSQFPYYMYSHPQYTYTTPSGYYHPSMVHPGALELYAHPTPGYILPLNQPIPIIPPPLLPKTTTSDLRKKPA